MFQIPPPPPEPAPLADVVVTAARLPPAAGEAAFSVRRLGQDALDDGRRVDDVLRDVPAVSLFRRTNSLAANPTTQGISLRAIAPTGAGRALVTLDGVPLNDPFGGWVIWAQAPSETLGGLDVVRGAGAGPYGAGALTGVIQLRERDDGAVLDLSAGERGGARAAGFGAIDAGSVRLSAGGLYETSDGYVPVRGQARGAADAPLDLETYSGSIRADMDVAEARLSLRAGAYSEARGSGLVGARARATGDSLSATLVRAPVADRPGWRLQAWRRTSDLANSSAAVAAGRASTTPANDQFATPAEGWGVNAALRQGRRPLAGGLMEWEVGADARISEGETRELFRYMGGQFTRGRVAGGRTEVAGVYAEASVSQLGPWLLAGGVRVDRWANGDGRRVERDLATGAPTLDETDPDRSGEVFSGRLGARYDLGGGQALRAAAYTGFRPATLNELHRPFRVGNDLTEANAALEPERLKGAELGWSWQTPRAALAATAFWTRLDDAIVNVTIGQGPGTFPRAGFVPAGGVLRQRGNAGTIEAQGLELDARWSLGDRLTLRGAVSGTDARLDGGSAAPQLTGLRPAQAPIWSAVAGLDWRPVDRLGLAVDARWESRRFDDDLNSRVLDAATTLDARAEWRLSPAAAVWLRADNLLDAEIEVSRTGDNVVGLTAPRTLSAGLRLTR